MSARRIRLVFPPDKIQQPIVFQMAKELDVTPNIRQAKVTDTVGEMTLELEGSEELLQKAIDYLKSEGVQVELASGQTNI